MGVLDRFRLTGKRLLVTGGSRGLGREMALACADAGADVALVGRDPDSLDRAAAEVRALGRAALPIPADVADPAECEAACRRALAEFGPIDVLINNAGGRRVRGPRSGVTRSGRAGPGRRANRRRWLPRGGRGLTVSHTRPAPVPARRDSTDRPLSQDGQHIVLPSLLYLVGGI